MLSQLAHQWLRVNCGVVAMAPFGESADAEKAGDVLSGDSNGIVTGDMGREGDVCSFFAPPAGAVGEPDLAYT